MAASASCVSPRAIHTFASACTHANVAVTVRIAPRWRAPPAPARRSHTPRSGSCCCRCASPAAARTHDHQTVARAGSRPHDRTHLDGSLRGHQRAIDIACGGARRLTAKRATLQKAPTAPVATLHDAIFSRRVAADAPRGPATASTTFKAVCRATPTATVGTLASHRPTRTDTNTHEHMQNMHTYTFTCSTRTSRSAMAAS